MKHRLYSFINHLYMSPLQWGIQTAHCVSTMSRCKKTALQTLAYNEWADEEPTIIVLQGGNLGSLKRLEDTLFPLAQKLELPFASFREDQESLGGILTAVSVLVPETLFDVKKEEFFDGTVCYKHTYSNGNGYSTYDENHNLKEFELIEIIKSARLA